jgi:serine protease Do
VDDSYEVAVIGGSNVWVNGNLVTAQRLEHGDTVEFGDTGPLCRLRFYTDRSPVRNSVPDILTDIATYLRVSRQRLPKRLWRAAGALLGRLSFETSLLFRITVLAAIVGLGVLAYQQQRLSNLMKRDFASTTAQLDNVASALANTRKEALRPSDLAALRENLEQRLTSNRTRLKDLELRSTAAARVIAKSSASVAFLQGAYGFREQSGERMLRRVIGPGGIPLMTPRGQPFLTLEGDGPVAELEFTGTGFFVGGDGLLITNRHVAQPWQQSAGVAGLPTEGVVPVMLKFVAYLPDQPEPLPLSLVTASDGADLAVLQVETGGGIVPGLELATRTPASGDAVIVMGYPTGLRSMLAQSGADFIKKLQEDNNTDFWSVAASLAREGYIAPLASRGIVGQVTPATIVYDAETTYGGSGGPVLDINGKVVAVNTAIFPEYGGSNLGVPVSQVQMLLQTALSN